MTFYSTMWLHNIILIFALINGLECLRITELIIPRHANLGTSVTLVCKFDLGRGRLYSVKWYKDEQEFFRYMPEYHPQSQIFPQVGVQLDETMSDMNRVTLSQVGYGSSGLYKCEVSTEAPAFETAIYNGSMEVLAFPDGDPIITGVAPTYSVGDYITGNCTSARSKPPPILSWFINGVKADSWLLDKYEVLEHPGPVFSRSLGLRFQAEKRHFQGHGQTVMLKCQVQVSDLSPQIKTVTPQLASGASANQKLAQQRLRNAAGTSGDKKR